MVVGADQPASVFSENLSVFILPFCSTQLAITPRSEEESCGRLLLAPAGPIDGVTVSVHGGGAGAAAGVALVAPPSSLFEHAATAMTENTRALAVNDRMVC